MIPKGLLPEGFSHCIAGGWAACPVLASDMDVWVFQRDGKESLEDIRDQILAHLMTTKPYKWGITELPDKRNEREANLEYDTMPFDTLKVADVRVSYPQGSIRVHIMVTNASSPQGIISAFDISTHAIAIDERGVIIRDPEFTDLWTRPSVLRMTETTPQRLKKICERYRLEEPTIEEV